MVIVPLRHILHLTATGPDASALDVARYQGQRLARYAAVIAEARSRGAFAVRRPSPEAFLGATLT